MRTGKRHYRLQDPIHGLITFRGREQDDTERIAWRLINTPEFQRLRRIRQLGFSELVFPGATHSRFAHSIGVFHMARRLIGVIGLNEKVDPAKSKVALLAALLHDIGHGPFSHAFEGAMKTIGRRRKHEQWTADIITGETEIRRVLDDADSTLAPAIAALLKKEEPQDIYDTLVASQFDADRLDYLQRDRYMTGVGGGGFDLAWLLDCLEIGEVPPPAPNEGGDAEGDELEDVPAFYLNNKGYCLSRTLRSRGFPRLTRSAGRRSERRKNISGGRHGQRALAGPAAGSSQLSDALRDRRAVPGVPGPGPLAGRLPLRRLRP